MPINAEEYLESMGWHQESNGLWNNVKEKKHGRSAPDLISAHALKVISAELTRVIETINP